jgi:hypothetical protein
MLSACVLSTRTQIRVTGSRAKKRRVGKRPWKVSDFVECVEQAGVQRMLENVPPTLQALLVSLNSARDELNRPLAETGYRFWKETELQKFSTEDKSMT